MSKQVILKTLAARLDLAGCYAYIGEHNSGAAHRFRLAAEQTFEALARTPGIGAPYETSNPRLAGLRCAQVGRFRNYVIFYRPIPEGIDIIRVLHAARDIRAILEDVG